METDEPPDGGGENLTLGHLSSFDHKSGEWSIFKGRLIQYLKVNNVQEVNKSAILITHLSDESYRLVRNLAYPDEIDALSYNQLVKLLDGHFKTKQCSFADKAKFYGATRHTGESLGDWAARLRGLASYCDFGTALETNLTDRFVLGLGAGPERDKLFEQDASTLKLARALEIAEKAECARAAKLMVSTEAITTIKEEPIYRASFEGSNMRAGRGRAAGQRGRTPSAAARPPPSYSSSGPDHHTGGEVRCPVCGMKNHTGDVCRFKGYRCQVCGVKGHLKKVCDKNKCLRVNNLSTNDGEDSDCEECNNFNLRSSK
ncbi:uncharacterized protein LOC126380920 [Pectinophora gossypiella]|uniref:uncharacterized protein LOC126380920 n=1 Tax=Pectinophora gossypiella TaxID=13191 RepID=UPI00214EAC4C|nr:uncharacterized protein LOC126380920 [Pectinophora gossypiella]